MTMLERVIYESRATGRTDSLLNMATILAESQRNNERDGLTGVLAAHDDRYIQVLEGTTPAIDRLLRRLLHDARHKDVTILDRRPIETRSFGEWAMANARIHPDQAANLDGVMASHSSDAMVALLLEAIRATSG